VGVNVPSISMGPWCEGHSEVGGEALPFLALQESHEERRSNLDGAALPAVDPLRMSVLTVAAAAPRALGIGVAPMACESR